MTINRQGPGKIEWTDSTWNPFTGCDYGCDYCYARMMAKRFGRSFHPEFRPDRFEDLKKIKLPSRIFVPSSGEMLGPWVRSDHIRQTIDEMAKYPQHIFQVLTKNPKRFWDFEWPSNCWLGTTDDGTEWTRDNVANLMLNCDGQNKKFVSFEPMIRMPILSDFLATVDWMIIGGRTGRQRFKPPQIWVEKVIAFARIHDIKVFVKDNAGYPHEIKEFP
jgi:protein gp37